MSRQQQEARGDTRCHQQEDQGSRRRGTDAGGTDRCRRDRGEQRATDPEVGPRAGAPDGRSCPCLLHPQPHNGISHHQRPSRSPSDARGSQTD